MPDTEHTQQDNVSFTQADRLTALTTASNKPWITLNCLTVASYTLPGWSACIKNTLSNESDYVCHEMHGIKSRAL